MPLYLDEIWLRWESLDAAKQSLALFGRIVGDAGFPEGVTLKAGPWFSNEEAKIVLILDIADHAKTFVPFGMALANGMLTRRRLTPIVEWGAVEGLLAAMS